MVSVDLSNCTIMISWYLMLINCCLICQVGSISPINGQDRLNFTNYEKKVKQSDGQTFVYYQQNKQKHFTSNN